ncbi:hypothetical protein YC2023_045012 [Brassica napus]
MTSKRVTTIHVSQMVTKLCYISKTSVFGLRISSYIAGPIRLINLSTCQGFDTDCKDLIWMIQDLGHGRTFTL